MLSDLYQNSFVTGTLMVLISGAIATKAMALPSQLWKVLRRRFLVTLELDSSDEGYRWLTDYLSVHAKTRWFGLRTSSKSEYISSNEERKKDAITLHPRGFCWIRFKNRRIYAWITKESVQGILAYREVIELQSLFGTKELFAELVSAARAHSRGGIENGFDVAVPDGGYDWRVVDRKPARNRATVCMPPGVLETVLEDVKTFLASSQQYYDRGIPYRRCYLFHGPPGNGKSTLAQMIASEFGRNLSVLTLSAVSSDTSLIELMGRVPSNNVIAIEDVDAAHRDRKSTDGKISFSGLLNVLDGPLSRNGQIIVMSTNHIDRLDPALIRPGRVDFKQFIDNASDEQARAMFRRFFGEHPILEIAERRFVAAATGKSMAAIQGALLAAKTEPATAVEHLQAEASNQKLAA